VGDDLLGCEGDGDALAMRRKDVAFVVAFSFWGVGVVGGDAGSGGRCRPVLVDDPLRAELFVRALVNAAGGCAR